MNLMNPGSRGGKLFSSTWIRSFASTACDPSDPCKLLSGLGGVGKTTLVREFVEEVVNTCPLGLEKVIWLSAKKQFYTAIRNKYVPTRRVDFSDVISLLRAMLQELGSPAHMIEQESSERELVEEVVKSLKIVPSLVVIDDVDSLDEQEQGAVLHTIERVMNQTVGTGNVPSRALLTARLTLGAPPGLLKKVDGLEIGEFAEFVVITAKEIGLDWNHKASSKVIQRFRRVTDGSPTFANSILRLVVDGAYPLNKALDKWEGSDGEEARKFAFENELEKLADSRIRTLYALCLLGESSQVELKEILDSSDTLLQDDLGELRKYHLLVIAGEIPRGGPRIVVPSAIQMMTDLIRSRVHDPKRIEAECAKARKGAPTIEGRAGRVFSRVMGLLRAGQASEALEVARLADIDDPDNGDLKCLLGHVYLKLEQPKPDLADTNLRRAFKLGCKRPELFRLWADAKRLLGDWLGIVEITALGDKGTANDDIALLRAEALSVLGGLAEKARNFEKATEYFLDGANGLSDILNRGQGRVRWSPKTGPPERQIKIEAGGVVGPN